MKSKITLEEARLNYETAEEAFYKTEQQYAALVDSYMISVQQRDQAWYEYVRYGTTTNYTKFEENQRDLEQLGIKKDNMHLNYKLAKCQFRKAKRLYNKLQKRAEKHAKQMGEE